MYYDASATRLQDWLNDKSRPRDLYKRNLEFLREAKDIRYLIGRNKLILWFVMVKLGIEDVRAMFNSCTKQQALVVLVKEELKKRGVTAKYEKMFRRELASIRRRTEYVYKITLENLRMSEYYPYFESVGLDYLNNYVQDFTKDNTKEAEEKLLADITKWNSEHTEEIATYMASIKEEKEAMERHREQIKADKKREKEEARRARAEIRAFEKESARIRKQREYEDRKLERSFEKYYRKTI